MFRNVDDFKKLTPPPQIKIVFNKGIKRSFSEGKISLK